MNLARVSLRRMAVLFAAAGVWSLTVLGVGVARADLSPDVVGVVVNKNASEGVELARYYMGKRSIPHDHLYLLDLPTEESITWNDYQTKLVAPLRAAMEKSGQASKIRVLVLMRGVPLHVLAPEPTADEKQALQESDAIRLKALAALTELAHQSDEVTKSLGGTPPEDFKELESTNSDEVRISHVNDHIRAAGERLQHFDAADDKAVAAKTVLNRVVNGFGGFAAVLQAVRIAPGQENEQATKTLEQMRSEVERSGQLIAYLDETKSLVNRQRAMSLTARSFGASGTLLRTGILHRWLSYENADASVDSELGFLWWDQGMYLVSERVPNPHFHRYQKGADPQFQLPVMLVSRLDGPSIESVRGLIDRALEAEAKGLDGKVYVDARGLKDIKQGYGVYDQSLRDFAWLVRESTGLSATLENTEKTMSDPGTAPDTALYCGWYRLRHYEPAFAFRPGAIGYHIASEEAVSLRDPGEQGWCKRAIEEGITVTLGPVSEPLVDAFPLPEEFFGLLLTGSLPLIDVYGLTNPFLSWKMVLIGDPFYMPYKKHPELKPKDIAAKSEAAKTLDPLPTAPTERPFPDPVAVRKQIAERRVKLSAEIEKFYAAVAEHMKNAQNGAAGQAPKTPKK